MRTKTLIGSADDDDFADSIIDEAENVILKVTDTVEAHRYPPNIDITHVEKEYDRRAIWQRLLFAARGKAHSLRHRVTAARLGPRAETVGALLKSHFDQYEFLVQEWKDAKQALGRFVRRASSSKLIYYGFMVAFLLGDIAGIGGAQILLGEIPALAIIQAMAAAAATVVAGFVGRDIRDIERHRYRLINGQLPDELKRYEHKLRGRHSGEKLTWQMVILAAAVAVFIGAAIFALRASVNGPLVGIIYGALAIAIAGGSALNTWSYTDDVADLLDTYLKALRVEEANLHRLSKDRDVQAKLAADESARSIEAQNLDLGHAAEQHMLALKEMILRENPQIAGHGRVTSQQPLFTDEQLTTRAHNGFKRAS